MIIGLVGIIISLFAILSGPKEYPLVEDIDKFAKKVVVDKELYAHIKAESKSIAKLSKEYAKQTKVYSKEMLALVEDQTTTRSAFEALNKAMLSYESSINSDYFAHRSNILNEVTDEEWKGIVDHATKAIQKDRKARQKALDKYVAGLEKRMSRIVNSMSDNTKSRQAKTYLDAFEQVSSRLTEDLLMVYHNNANLLKNRTSTIEDIQGISAEFEKDWRELYNAYVDLHQNLASLCDKDEWKKVGKQLTKI
jgi:hypothetical protein